MWCVVCVGCVLYVCGGCGVFVGGGVWGVVCVLYVWGVWWDVGGVWWDVGVECGGVWCVGVNCVLFLD